MPMERQAHEDLLSELLNPELEQSRRTEVLQSLRKDYDQVITDQEKLTTSNEDFKAKNADLVIANSKLFRQVGIEGGSDDQKKQEEQKSFSETVKLEDLESRART